MVTRQLSPEIVSLIHHVSLNESGWWKKAIFQVIQAVLWKQGAPLNRQSLAEAIERELGHSLSDSVLRLQLSALIAQGAVVELPDGTIKLTEKVQRDLLSTHTKAINEREECIASFKLSCTKYCATLPTNEVWTAFSQGLIATVRISGANLFHLLGDGNLERDKDWLTPFFDKFDIVHREGLRKVVADFFAKGNQPCRNQVLRMMSGQFFAEASQLSDATIKALEGDKKKRVIRVILDTNFVFSVLDLHDNPSDGSALSLIELAGQARQHLEVKFYVLPATIDEAQHVLSDQRRAVERVRATSAMARAALTQPLSGIARRYFAAAATSNGLSPAEYFKPYVEDLRTILVDKGISVLEAHPAIYNQRQDVVDDVLAELKWEELNIPENRRKSYETLLHDVVLWHAVNDRRPSHADSPFEMEYWAVSIDRRLIGFDRNKKDMGSSKLPVVLHPNNLVQLVQFWVPRSSEMDASLIDSLTLPLYFQSFDVEDERATIKVLEALSRYENQDDISEQTITKILANQVLRARLRDSDAANDVIFELVREELLIEHRQNVEKLSKAELSNQELSASLAQEQQMRADAANSFVATAADLEIVKKSAIGIAQEKSVLAEKLEQAGKQLKIAEQSAKGLTDKNSEVEVALQKTRFINRFLLMPLLFSAFLVALVIFKTSSFNLTENQKWMALCFAFSFPVLVAGLVVKFFPKQFSVIETWWLPRVIKWFALFVVFVVGLAIQGVFQGHIYDVFKELNILK